VRRAFRLVHLSSMEEKFDGLLTSFAEGLSAVGSSGQMLTLLLMTAAIWTTEAGLIWGLAKALGLAVSLKSAVVASAVLGLGLMIPAAPGGLGTYELFGTEAFKLAGIAASSALALTVVIHAWVFVANIAVGSLLLAVKGISLAQLRSRLQVDSVAGSSIQRSN
jgi:glycosyltransferase 2 family protein